MKNIYSFIIVLLLTMISYAQVPQGISYQAIAFDGSNNPVVSSNVALQISILDTSISGTTVYVETHTAMTNSLGLFNLNIGQGTAITGAFATIDWANNNKFLKVELDPAGGTSYTSVGTNQLMTVPYAMMAGNVDTSNLSYNSIKSGGQTGKLIVVYTDTNAYGFYQNSNASGYWSSQSLSGNVIGAVASDNSIVVYTDTNAYGFYQNSGASGYWSSQSLSGNVLGASSSKKMVVVHTDTNAYGFYQNSGASGYWSSQSLSGASVKVVASNENIVVYTDTNAYGFYQNNEASGYWSSQSLSGTPIGADSSNKTIVIYTDTNAYGFYQNTGASGYWSSQSLSGMPSGIIGR